MTVTERQDIEGYLSHKWPIYGPHYENNSDWYSRLSNEHPHQNNPPIYWMNNSSLLPTVTSIELQDVVDNTKWYSGENIDLNNVLSDRNLTFRITVDNLPQFVKGIWRVTLSTVEDHGNSQIDYNSTGIIETI